MLPSRPYLFRALVEWVIDNGWTPHIVVDATDEAAEVPAAFVQEGRITLNVSPTAVRDYQQSDEELSFSARFAGTAHAVRVPMRAILAVFARESGQGMMFGAEPGHDAFARAQPAGAPGTASRKGFSIVPSAGATGTADGDLAGGQSDDQPDGSTPATAPSETSPDEVNAAGDAPATPTSLVDTRTVTRVPKRGRKPAGGGAGGEPGSTRGAKRSPEDAVAGVSASGSKRRSPGVTESPSLEDRGDGESGPPRSDGPGPDKRRSRFRVVK